MNKILFVLSILLVIYACQNSTQNSDQNYLNENIKQSINTSGFTNYYFAIKAGRIYCASYNDCDVNHEWRATFEVLIENIINCENEALNSTWQIDFWNMKSEYKPSADNPGWKEHGYEGKPHTCGPLPKALYTIDGEWYDNTMPEAIWIKAKVTNGAYTVILIGKCDFYWSASIDRQWDCDDFTYGVGKKTLDHVGTAGPFDAQFSADVTEGIVPLSVNFSDETSGCPGPDTWQWNFGDGNSSSSQNPSHVYTQPGSYTVRLNVYRGETYRVENKINYIEVNPPIPNPPIIILRSYYNHPRLFWNYINYADSYYIYRRTGTGSFIKIKTTSSNYFIDNELLVKKPGSPKVNVSYKIKAHNNSGESAFSNVVSGLYSWFDES